MKALLTTVVGALLLSVACGGPGGAGKTPTVVPAATATPGATATGQVATSTAQPQPTAIPSPAAQHWLDTYEGLPDTVKARIEELVTSGNGRDRFVEAMSWLASWELTYEHVQSLAQLFQAIGKTETMFIPVEFYAGAFPVIDGDTAAPFYQARGLDIDDETIRGALTGTAFLTGNEVARLLEILAGLATLEEGQEISKPPQVEVVGFFTHLPPDVKAKLEGDGWNQERIIPFLLGLDGTPTLEEMRSFFGPLSDTPIPPFADAVTGSLNHMPPFSLDRVAEQIGERALVELMMGSRAPTGGEFMAVYEIRNPAEGPGGKP